PASLELTIPAGQNFRGDLVRVSNSGEGVLQFNAAADVPWLGLFPTNGTSAGPEQRVLATFNTSLLPVGDYNAHILITSSNASKSPQIISVKLHIVPSACFWEPFDYYDGNLT